MKITFSKRIFLIRMVLCMVLLTSCFDGEETKKETQKEKHANNITYWEDVVLEEETMVEETITEETWNVTYW